MSASGITQVKIGRASHEVTYSPGLPSTSRGKVGSRQWHTATCDCGWTVREYSAGRTQRTAYGHLGVFGDSPL